jgi:vacuolar-type H+-ATPase subunit I/STV1
VSSAQKRDELRRGIVQRDASIAESTEHLAKEAEIHQRNLESIREACRIIRDKCMVPRSQAEDSRYAVEVGRLND